MKKEAKPIEHKRYIDADTGELYEVPVIMHYDKGHKDFEMIFYGHFLDILNDLGNKKIQILQYIVKNKSKSENLFVGTVRDIAKALNISIPTVHSTIVLLEDKGAIKRRTGVIYIDPDLVSDGRFKDRIMHVYHSIDEETEEEKKARLLRELSKKEAEIEKLKSLVFS
jgi:DNA-binding Lrp family transcriptional regulator